MANLFAYFDGALPRSFTEMKVCLKNIFKRGYEEIRDRKLLEILKKDRTWLKYELKMFFKHTFISVNDRGRAPSKYINKLAIGFYFSRPEVKQYGHGSNTNYIVMSKRRPHFFSKII
jgi:hypothetical protein